MNDVSYLVEHKKATAIFLEDEAPSIEFHTRIARTNGMHVVVARSVRALERELNSCHWKPILFLDMHMTGVIDLREVNAPEIKTDQGEAVAIAVIRGYLPKTSFRDIPANILTGYPISDAAYKQIRRAKDTGRDVAVVMKTELDKFENIIKMHVNTTLEPLNSMRNINAAELVISEWTGNDYVALGKLLGRQDVKHKDSWQAEKSALKLDELTRVAKIADEILYIKESLARLFGSDDAAALEFNWLKQPDKFLGYRSPWELLMSGVECDRKKVVGLVGRLVG